MTAKVCSVHFVTYLTQSNIMASELGTTLPTLDIALTQLKDILKVKWINIHKASQRRESSYFDREEEKKVTMLRKEVYFKLFKALYWLAKEKIVSTKITSLLGLIEKWVLMIYRRDRECLQTRSELISFVKCYDYNNEKAETVFIDCN